MSTKFFPSQPFQWSAELRLDGEPVASAGARSDARADALGAVADAARRYVMARAELEFCDERQAITLRNALAFYGTVGGAQNSREVKTAKAATAAATVAEREAYVALQLATVPHLPAGISVADATLADFRAAQAAAQS